MSKRVFEIDGNAFDDLEGFFDEIQCHLLTAPWGRNLDAFNDVLRGGFGTPDEGFVLRWLDSDRSRSALGYPATIRYLEGCRRPAKGFVYAVSAIEDRRGGLRHATTVSTLRGRRPSKTSSSRWVTSS